VELTAILAGRGSPGSQERASHRIRTAESAVGLYPGESELSDKTLPCGSAALEGENLIRPPERITLQAERFREDCVAIASNGSGFAAQV
jgi:hypothetical protein